MWYSLVAFKQTGAEEVAATVKADRSSPWFSGHFPDDPILPGIAQVIMVAEVIAQLRQENLCMNGLSRVKFRKLVRPGDYLDIRASADKKKNHYQFEITSQNDIICSGIIILNTHNSTSES